MGYTVFEMGDGKVFYDTLLLRSAIKQLGAPAEVGQSQNQTKWMKGVVNQKRNTKRHVKILIRNGLFHMGAIKRLIC